MNLYVYPTDPSWYSFLSRQPQLDEVNFWRPGGAQAFRQLAPGELLLFRLRSPANAIAGGGFFVHFSFSPLMKAWEAFGIKNGTPDYETFLRLIARHKDLGDSPQLAASANIGCIILAAPFFLPRERWISVPDDYPITSPQGGRYDATRGTGRALYLQVTEAIRRDAPARVREWAAVEPQGEPVLRRQRIGQGAFRMLVADLYEKRCAVTGEKTYPVLQAAHILPVSHGGQHRPDNGMLLRSDIHTLFDLGYVTVTPNSEFRVSEKLATEWRNGRVYYELDGHRIRLPHDRNYQPAKEFLEWHNQTIFRG